MVVVVVVVVVLMVVVNGRQIFSWKIRNPDAFRSKHSSYCSVPEY